MNFLRGEILNIHKPLGMTSFLAVSVVRARLCRAMGVKKLKVGHTGTLDPLATGVLVVCTGKYTKRIDALQLHDKEYVATLQFGATTASYDKEYEESAWFSTAGVSEETIRAVLPQFIGDISQVPPAFSACSIDGKRAYEYARAQEAVALKARTVHISELELLSYDDELKRAVLRIVCGKGTYIRALARDLGAALQSGAYLTALCRTRVGDYKLQDAIAIADFSSWLREQEIEMDETK